MQLYLAEEKFRKIDRIKWIATAADMPSLKINSKLLTQPPIYKTFSRPET